MLADSELLAKLAERSQALSPETMAGLTQANMAAALEAVYFASIRMEEGEKVLPSVLLVSESNFVRIQENAQVLWFHSRDQISPEVLRKRSLAFDRREASFLAVPDENGIVLVGVAHWFAPASPGVVSSQSWGLLFDAEDTGTVSIALARTRLGVFRDGNFYSSRQSVFASPAFKRCLSTTFSRLRDNDDQVLAYMTTLQYIVERSIGFGRGGTIIALDDFILGIDDILEAGEKIQYDARKSPYAEQPQAIDRSAFALNLSQTSIATLSPERKSHLRFVARLSCIDGALILNHKLHPVRMGAKLKAPTSSETVYLGGAQDNAIGSVLRGVGTRHSSALNFISAAKRAVAFTISSDGPVSAFGWQDGRLSWWKNAV